MDTQAKQKLPIAMALKPGQAVGTLKTQHQEEICYLPVPLYSSLLKPLPATTTATITTNSLNNNNSLIINNNAATIKAKLTSMNNNLLKNQLKNNAAAAAAVPATVSNKYPNSLLSLINNQPTSSKTNASNNNNKNSTTTTTPKAQATTTTTTTTTNGAAVNAAPSMMTLLSSAAAAGPAAKVAPQKSATTPVSPTTSSSVSLIAKSRAPVILSRAAVEKICFKFGQVQAQANAGTLVLRKAKNQPNGGKPLVLKAKIRKNSAGDTPTTPTTPAATGSLLMPTNSAIALPDIKITPLPAAPAAAAAVTLNGSKLMKLDDSSMPMIAMPPTMTTTTITTTTDHTEAATNGQQASPKLQRSKSLVAPVPENAPSNASERRHSVAIMAKEQDVVVQTKPIETITIDDDDSDEEEQKQTEKKSATPTPIASRKSSSNSSSDLEVIFVPVPEAEQPKPAVQPKPAEQPQVQQVPAAEPQTSTMSIVKAESLPLSKEEFEKSLRCDEHVDSTSPPSKTSANLNTTPLSKLQDQIVEHWAEKKALSSFKMNMQQNFNMLQWREQQPGTLQNSRMRFELNRFNFLQLNERCERRTGPASYFERALYDRPGRRPNTSTHPLLYLCSRCKYHGPASDFLAPQYCSLACVRRAHKRRNPSAASGGSASKVMRTQEAKSKPTATVTSAAPAQQPQQQKTESKSSTGKRVFRWTEYLNVKNNGYAAPIHLFLNPFPISTNCFELGMKLEAIDPENCSLFCVCTIVEVRGYRLKLSFDGYSSMYDFWVNADSMDIFPPGWCERTSRLLQPPKGMQPERFSWCRYLVKTNAKAAPRALFTHLNDVAQPDLNGFSVGMHLEAEDLNDTGKICVATVADKLDERIRVHFDGWDDCYDFWVHVNSPYIHHCGWHEGRQQLIVPPDYQNAVFNWSSYIKEMGGQAAPAELFAARDPMEFQARMKLEVVDQRNPCLIRPATVVTRKGYRVQLHLDCWPAEYYFWLEDDSPDLHPIGWCEATSHELETPPGFQQRGSPMPCEVEGCRGFGNAKRFSFSMHALRECCPYAPENWRQWRAKTVKPPRVPPELIKQAPSRPTKTEQPKPAPKAEKTEPKPKPKRELEAVAPVTAPAAAPAPAPSPTPTAAPRPRSTPAPTPRPTPTATPTPIPTPESLDDEPFELDQRCLSIAKSIVSDYGPQYTRNYRLWQQNTDFDMDQLKSNPLYWTNWDVYEFVERALKSVRIAKMLFDEDIDGRALLLLGRQDLSKRLKLKVGPVVKLFALIVNLRIAVACKFSTKQTGFEIDKVLPDMSQGETTSDNEASLLENEDNPAFNIVSSNNVNYTQEELSDEEDVLLDSEDFLSVKTSMDVVPATVAS